MARIFIEGFESGSGALTNWSGNLTVISTSGLDMSGSWCLRKTVGGASGALVLPNSYSELYFAFKLRLNSIASNVVMYIKDSAGTIIVSLMRSTTSNKLYVNRGRSNGTTLETGSALIDTTTVTHLIEIHYKPSNTAGIFVVKVDGVEDISITADELIDTTNGLENVQAIHIGYDNTTGADADCYIDDLIIDDADWIGNTSIQAVAVTGAGATNSWDPSAATNRECVDEIPYNDSDYISTNVANEVDTFAMGDLTGSIISIKSVQVEARIAYEGSPTPTHIRLGCRSGGADHFDGDDQVPPVSFARKVQMLENNPNGDIPWTESSVNAAEFGVKATA